MSNVFNSSQYRDTVLKILGKKNAPSTSDPKSHFPRQFTYDHDKINAKYIAELVVRHNLKPRIPEVINELVKEDPFDFPFFNTDFEEETEFNADPPDTVEIPQGTSHFIPKYYPRFKVSPYDQTFLNQCMYHLLVSVDSDENTATMQHLLRAAKTCAYGNGSIKGMTTRLEKMREIADGIGKNKPRPIYSMGYGTLREVSEMFDKYLPLPPIEGGEEALGLNVNLSHMVDPISGESQLPTVNRKAMAGAPFSQVEKKESHIIDAIFSGDMFLQGVSTALTDGIDDESTDKLLKEVLADFGWLRIGYLFPKSERYDIDKWETKTRCIWAAPFTTHLLLGAASTTPLEGSPNALFYDTPSLAKFNPFHGGLNVIVQKSISPGSHFFVYADNIYLSLEEVDGSHTWYSIDLEKGESNATPDKASAIAYHLLTRGWSTVEGEPNFNVTWATTLLRLAPHMVVNPLCVLGNSQFPFPGQGSGNAWTFLINHLLSALVVEKMSMVRIPGEVPRKRTGAELRDLRPDDNPTSKFQAQMLAPLGLNAKVEATIKDLELKLNECRASAPDVGYFASEPTEGPPPVPMPTVDLDLLGWAATWSHFHERFIPTLDPQRLYKTAALARGPEDRQEDEAGGTVVAQQIYYTARYEALRMVGGCNYPIIDIAASEAAERHRSRAAKAMAALGESASSAAWENGLSRTEFGEELNNSSVQERVTGAAMRDLHGGDPKPKESVRQGIDRLKDRQVFNERQYQSAKTSLSAVGRKIQTGAVSRIGLSPKESLLRTEVKATLAYRAKLSQLRNDLRTSPAEQESIALKLLLRESTKAVKQAEDIAKVFDVTQTHHQQAEQRIAPTARPREKSAAKLANPVAMYHVSYPLGASRIEPKSRNARKRAAKKARERD
ncbi:RNA-dependant RNA polymerase [Tellina virus 1]|uniref:RNA-directed RNA polymerase n=1 Tax=Tellina virus 1 TaxID=321302 RepID=Q2PBR4_9VIRU|nr:RNA-dependant RNA polymerase [Tellina virus 1]CAI74982.1 RNA-dependant RNA polymerase [Tellina virus 1]